MNKITSTQYLYKYLPRNYAEDLLYKGIVHFRHAAYFLGLEGDAARSDKHDGARIFNTSIAIKDSSGEKASLEKAYTVRSQEELKTSYIFCASKSLRADLFSGFNTNYCVIIKDVNEFKKRILSKANCVNLHLTKEFFSLLSKKIEKVNIIVSYLTNIISDDVIYFDDSEIEDKIVLSPDIKQKFFRKRRSLYQWEDEYRFLIEPKGKITFTFSQEDQEIVNSFMKHNLLSGIFPVGINVIIGNIEDIAEIKMAGSS